MPAPASDFRFSLKYTGDKAARMASASIPSWEMRYVFKEDLTALGVNHPKIDSIQKGPLGTVYFIYHHNNKTIVRLFG